jgi:hypothetical protein
MKMIGDYNEKNNFIIIIIRYSFFYQNLAGYRK